MMTIRDISQACNGYSGTSITVAKPATLQPGDTMLVGVMAGVGATISAPSGWSLVDASPDDTAYTDRSWRMWVFGRVAGSSEPSSYVFRSDVATALAAHLVAYEGSASVDVSAGEYDGVSQLNISWQAALPDITTTVDGCTIVYLIGLSNGQSADIAGVSAGTLRDVQTTSYRDTAIADLDAPVAGVYADVKATISSWGEVPSVAVALVPGTIGVSVVVTPATAQVVASGTRQFSATVYNATDPSVTWSVVAGGAGGSIDASGLYTAPPGTGTDTVRATSVEDPSAYAEATITIVPLATIVPVRIRFERRGIVDVT